MEKIDLLLNEGNRWLLCKKANCKVNCLVNTPIILFTSIKNTVYYIILPVIATPIGKELTFRGILTSALLRYRPWVCIIIGSLVFGLVYSLNEIFILAFIAGLAIY